MTIKRVSRGKLVPEISYPYTKGSCWRKVMDTAKGALFCSRIPATEYRMTKAVRNGSLENRPFVTVWLCETCAAAMRRSGYEVTKVTR